MKRIVVIFIVVTFLIAAPTWALDVQMGFDGNVVFEPSEITINAGESVHFVNNMLPPHNVIVENRDDLSHDALAMMPGEEFDVTFPEAGDFNSGVVPTRVLV